MKLVIPEYHTWVRYTEEDFWSRIIINEKLRDFMNTTLPSIHDMDSLYWVVGRRGSGKSQVLEIIARKCIENYSKWGVLPIIASISGLDDNAKPSEILSATCEAIARKIVYLYDDIVHFSRFDVNLGNSDWNIVKIFRELKELQNKYSPNKFSDIYTLEKLLNQISQKKIKYLLLIDEIDKINPMPFFSFLIHNQPFFSTLLGNNNVKMMISMSTEVYKLIQDKKVEEANFFRSRGIYPPSVETIEQCKKLIDSRIREKDPNWRTPFDDPSYTIIMKKCDGIPRDILRETGNILRAAYGEHLTKIPHEFVERYFSKIEKDDKFKSYIKKYMKEISPTRRMLKELSKNPTYARILNAFLLDPNAAKRGDYTTLQSLGDLGLDRAKYDLIIKEMEVKELLKDRGYGPQIVEELQDLLKEIYEKWDKSPVDIYEVVDGLHQELLSPVTTTSVQRVSLPIDNTVKEIITKNPFSTVVEIQTHLEDYKSGKELENWRKVLPLRLADLENSGEIIKIGKDADAMYVSELGRLTKDTVISIGDLSILRQLKLIDKLRTSGDEKGQEYMDNLLRLVREVIIQSLSLESNDISNRELLDIVRKKDCEEIEKRFGIFLKVIEVGDMDIAYWTALKIIIACKLYQKKIKELQEEKEQTISKLTKGMSKIDLVNIEKNVLNLPNDNNLISNLLSHLSSDYIPPYNLDAYKDFVSLYMIKGNIFKCKCGARFFSDSKNAYHLNCKSNMKWTEGGYLFPSEESKSRFLIALIEDIIRDVFTEKTIDTSIFISSNDGRFNYIIECGTDCICITNYHISEKDIGQTSLKIIVIDPINIKDHQTYSGIKNTMVKLFKEK